MIQNNKLIGIMFGLAVVMLSTLEAAPAGAAPSSASLEQLAQSPSYSDLPPPPPKPEKFTSKQQLKDYLIKLHEYYAIIGRPRFGRRSFDMSASSLVAAAPAYVDFNDDFDDATSYEHATGAGRRVMPDKLVLELVDQNRDGYASKKELNDFVKLWNQL